MIPCDQTTYQNWKDRLEGKEVMVSPDTPTPGFYRMRRKDSNGGYYYQPVSYYPKGFGEIACLVDSHDVSQDYGQEVWHWCEPVPEPEYRRVAEEGQQWSDVDPSIGRGHNMPPDADPIIGLKDEIDSARAGLQNYADITNDTQAKAAQSLRARLNELAGKADGIRETEKRPHLDAGMAIDKKWRPLITLAKDGADLIRKAMSAWETKKFAEAKAAQPKAAPPPAQPIKGGYGRAASVETVKVAVVTDWVKVYRHFALEPEVIALLLKLAQRAVDRGETIKGVKIEEQRRVK